MDITKGDYPFEFRLLDQFTEQTAGIIRKISAAGYFNGNFENLQSVAAFVHNLKGRAATILAGRICSAAKSRKQQ